MTKVNLDESFRRVTEPWRPKLVCAINGQAVKIARLAGAFVWHSHEHEDELFLVMDGRLRIELRDGSVDLGPGEMCVVPRGVEHRPVAEPEARVVLFEPLGTRNTGDVVDPRFTAPTDAEL